VGVLTFESTLLHSDAARLRKPWPQLGRFRSDRFAAEI
jgi:hypothetical protein